MKRFIIGISVLGALLAGSLAAEGRMEQLYRPVQEHLEQAVRLSAEGATEAAAASLERAKELWHRGWKFMAAFADHEPMEEVDDLFSAVSAYSPESAEFGAYCAQLLRRTAAVIRDQTLSWWNLL